MTQFWEQLETRQLPTATVPLPVEGGTVDVVLRALLPAEWEALCDAHPAAGEDVQPGQVDTRGMRSELLAASVVAPEGSPPKSATWWDALAKSGAATAGELDGLFEVAWSLNHDRPGMAPDLGKG